jgi:CDP-glycerol glycerophosphotransferase
MAEQKMYSFRARLDYILKHNYAINRIFNWNASIFMKVWGRFIPMDDEMVIFSGHARKYNDSPRVMYENMLCQPNKFGKYKCVWALEDPDSIVIPGNPIKVKADTLMYFKYTLKAKYWVTCVNIERSLHYKRKKCRYLNTWHGTPFKHVGNDAGDRRGYDFSSIDYFCYASVYEKEIYKRAFNTREEAMIPTGLPRNDTLYNVSIDEIDSIKDRLGLPLNKKIILYAPTWRESSDKGGAYVINPPITMNKWVESFKDEYIILFRTHAYTNKLLGIEFNDVVRDYTSYPVINDLFKITDILISDYSASMADYAILERPILCFAYDYEVYRDERGLYVDYAREMPSGILRTEDDVMDYVKNMNYAKECEKTRVMIKDRLIHLGGNATEMCLDKLFEH